MGAHIYRRIASAFFAFVVAIGLGSFVATSASAGGGSDACAPYTTNSWPLDVVQKSGKTFYLTNGDTSNLTLTVNKSTLTVRSVGDYPHELVVVLGGSKTYFPEPGTSTEVTFPKTALNNKEKAAFICGNVTAPTPDPDPQKFTVTASCGASSQNEGYNWAFIWEVTSDSVVEHTTQVVATNLTTGEVDGRGERLWGSGITGGSDVYEANVGNEVVIDYLIDGVRVPSLSFSGVIATDTACSGVYPAP